MCVSLARMEMITLEHGRLLPSHALNELRYCYMCWRGAFNRLYAEHLYFDSGDLSPCFLSNYLSEDMVRRVKNVASGSHPAFLAKHVKYALDFTLRRR